MNVADKTGFSSSAIRRTFSVAVLCALAVSTLAGCRWFPGHGHWPWDAKPAEEADGGDAAATLSAQPLELTDQPWSQALRRPAAESSEMPYRWRHPGLEQLVAGYDDPLSRLEGLLDHPHPVVRTNAAILLARRTGTAPLAPLVETIRSTQLTLPGGAVASPNLTRTLRLAAVEALGVLSQPSPVASLRELVDRQQTVQPTESGRAGAGYDAQIHAALLAALALHVNAKAERRLSEALRCQAPAPRAAALDGWAAGRQGPLPKEAVRMVRDPDADVRRAALAAIVATDHPQRVLWVRAALTDENDQVRQVAIDALGELRGKRVVAMLGRLLENGSPQVRSAAVRALATQGEGAAVRRAASDRSRLVRLEVAKALAADHSLESVHLALRLLDDPALEVQRQIIESVASWPLPEAGFVWLKGVELNRDSIRRAAGERFARCWPPADRLPVLPTTIPDPELREELKRQRTGALAELHAEWERQFGSLTPPPAERAMDPHIADPAGQRPAGRKPAPSAEQVALVRSHLRAIAQEEGAARSESLRRLISQGASLTGVLEAISADGTPIPEAVFLDVLPPIDSTFDALADLKRADTASRRLAAARLVERNDEDEGLSHLAIERIAAIVVTEPDALVWRSVLIATENDRREPAARVAAAALGHPAAEVRRRACRHFGLRGEGKYTKLLLPSLDDPDDAVVLASAEAIGRCGKLDDVAPLARLAAHPSKDVQLAAAVALARLGAVSGRSALERLTHDPDPAYRRQAAEAMGPLADPVLVPTLIRLLDDRAGVQRAAMKSLVQIAGHDVGNSAGTDSGSPADQVRRWKQWYASSKSP